MAVNDLTQFKDRNGFRYPLPRAPSYVDYRVFAAATAEAHTVPAGAKTMIVIALGTITAYVALSGTAAVPAADVTDGSGSIPCPAGYPRPFPVTAAGTVSVIADAAGVVALEFYS